MLTALALLFVKGYSYEIGDLVSDFKLKNVDGKMISLSDYNSSKGLIIIFDCNTCPYSKAYNQRIIDLNKKYVSQGYPVITINPNDPELSPGDSFDEMVSNAKKKNYSFPYLVDASQEVARKFGASNTPHVFVLKKEGKDFRVSYIGTIDNNSRDASSATKRYVEEAVDALLANKPIAINRTKAIGCGIKWKS
ncbi:MAG: thioredoxin family protein [Marivirga sp.]|nr:thioredoxin family protein [Marivirga sp.]